MSISRSPETGPPTGIHETALDHMLLVHVVFNPENQAKTGTSSVFNSKPPATATSHTLPLNKLSPDDFERLCLWLVRREGFSDSQHLGVSGSDEGCDIVAERDGERWVFQCKRVNYFGPKDAEKETAKLKSLSDDRRPQHLVFVTTCNLSSITRQRCCSAAAPINCYFWAGTELDERIKKHPDLLSEFFQIRADGPPSDARTHNVVLLLPFVKNCVVAAFIALAGIALVAMALAFVVGFGVGAVFTLVAFLILLAIIFLCFRGLILEQGYELPWVILVSTTGFFIGYFRSDSQLVGVLFATAAITLHYFLMREGFD